MALNSRDEFQIAQTDRQLYAQLRAQGWADADLARVEVAHELAVARFAGLVRKSGKSFLSHLVGTASLTAFARGGVGLTQAALLHAWRLAGVRVLGLRIPRLKRPFPRDLDSQIRERVLSYESVHRRYRNCAPGAGEIAVLSGLEREALLLHLANEIDDIVDHSWSGAKQHKAEPAHIAGLRELAQGLGYGELDELLCRSAEAGQGMVSNGDATADGAAPILTPPDQKSASPPH